MNEIYEIISKCLACKVPGCASFCPVGNKINLIMGLMKEGKEEEAAALLHSTNPFPLLTSPLCDHQRQCRGHCVFARRGQAIDFPSVENYLGRTYPHIYKDVMPNGHKVSIVGAGPAGLSAASFLIEAGFAVEILEKEMSIGGAIKTGIPQFRYDKKPLEDIQSRLEKAGVKFCFGFQVDKEKLAFIKKESDEVIIATGASKENALSFPDHKAILQALPILKEYNDNPKAELLPEYKKVVVMGGGNVAMDVSRTLIRKGKEVTLIYRRDESSMPAQVIEIAEAKEDGVIFNELTNATSPLIEDGVFKGLNLVKMCLGEKDESGRPSFHVIEGSDFFYPCDAFVMAIGEKSDAIERFGEEEGNVHFCGDCRYGAKNIASAIADGRNIAEEIINKYR